MIVIYHHNNKPTQVWDETGQCALEFMSVPLSKLLFGLAQTHPERLMVWCDETYRKNLNIDQFSIIFHHKKMMASFCQNGNFLPESIGYIEESSFIKINKKVTFPTWRMSSAVGGIDASVLEALRTKIKHDNDFDYFLNSLGKLAMPSGLFCYSEPQLLKGTTADYLRKGGNKSLFRFAKQHYKTTWLFLLLLDLLVYEKKFPLFSACCALFYKRRNLDVATFDNVKIGSVKKSNNNKSIDVVIPTIGRKPYLHDVLKDLAKQTSLPSTVIVIEQNPEPGSTTQLDYLTNENWPFKIKHAFIHQSGACNARNLALSEVESDWIFLADDDIRLNPVFLETAFEKISENANHVFNFACLNEGQHNKYKTVHQTSIFGSGCSIISKESLGDSRFDMAFEFGFSEDLEFAMQLMNKGFDTYYFPQPSIVHLKAPVGGFRTKPQLPWANDTFQPKPSPTVMLYKLMHHSKEQLLGYKTTLFFKFYNGQPIKNPYRYLKNFRKRWNDSIFWANHLRNHAS
ncbi:MAG TPA: glycosyltransferase family A protein [Flavobacterium sp.]|nr:glycosyltransferase family A protein [Flavobacterium sp.]